jgi:hypothetical protein
MRSSFVVTLLVSALSWLLSPPAGARADGQLSARHVIGIGKRKAEIGDDVVFTSGLRSELMFGKPEPRAFRFGPALELRTADFLTLEGAVGAGVLLPMPGDFPFGLTGLLGYASRRRAPDGPVAIATATWGYRGYNYHHWYGYGLNVFVSGRRDLTGDDLYEITGGIEIDVMFTTIIPLLFIRTAIRGEDPDEPTRVKPRR